MPRRLMNNCANNVVKWPAYATNSKQCVPRVKPQRLVWRELKEKNGPNRIAWNLNNANSNDGRQRQRCATAFRNLEASKIHRGVFSSCFRNQFGQDHA